MTTGTALRPQNRFSISDMHIKLAESHHAFYCSPLVTVCGCKDIWWGRLYHLHCSSWLSCYHQIVLSFLTPRLASFLTHLAILHMHTTWYYNLRRPTRCPYVIHATTCNSQSHIRTSDASYENIVRLLYKLSLYLSNERA